MAATARRRPTARLAIVFVMLLATGGFIAHLDAAPARPAALQAPVPADTTPNVDYPTPATTEPTPTPAATSAPTVSPTGKLNYSASQDSDVVPDGRAVPASKVGQQTACSVTWKFCATIPYMDFLIKGGFQHVGVEMNHDPLTASDAALYAAYASYHTIVSSDDIGKAPVYCISLLNADRCPDTTQFYLDVYRLKAPIELAKLAKACDFAAGETGTLTRTTFAGQPAVQVDCSQDPWAKTSYWFEADSIVYHLSVDSSSGKQYFAHQFFSSFKLGIPN